jgi:hypothetical protein
MKAAHSLCHYFICGAFLVLLSHCGNVVDSPNDNFADEFNARARVTFDQDFNTLDLYPLSDSIKDLWRVCISQHLDEMNSNKFSMVDSFCIRNYYSPELGEEFAFVAIHDKFYFLYLPRLYNFRHSKVSSAADDVVRPSDLVITRVNSIMIDRFLEEQVFIPHEESTQIDKALLLLPEIFPTLTRDQISKSDFMYWLKDRPNDNREIIESVLFPVFKRKPRFRSGQDYLIFNVEALGILVCDFHLDDEASLNMVLDIYFIPNSEKVEIGICY